MAIKEEEEVGLEEELSSWSPSHFLDETISETQKYYTKNQHPHLRQHWSLPLQQQQQQQQLRSKSSLRPYSRTKYPINWGSGGSGMQAVFLDSGKKSCGTGVFLPRSAGATLQNTKKPACSPVLLPARVVHALNLKVHELGLQISRRQDTKNSSKGEDNNSIISRNKEASGQCCVEAQNENSSSDIFLPKEWTYYY